MTWKKLFVAIAVIGAFALSLGALDSLAAGPTPTALGGLGTSTLPQAGQLPIGVSSTSYSPAYLLCSGNCSVATSSGSITITVPAQSSSTIQILPVAVGSTTFSIVGDGSYITVTNPATSTIKVALSTAQVLQLLSGSAPLAYNSSTGQFTFNTSTPLSLTGLYTFLGGITANSTATANSSTLLVGPTAIGTTTLNGALNIVGAANQAGGIVSLASTTIKGQATTTNLSITSLAGASGCLSVSASGLVATSTCSGSGGGGITGNSTSTYIAYWSASSTLAGDAGLKYSSDVLSINGTDLQGLGGTNGITFWDGIAAFNDPVAQFGTGITDEQFALRSSNGHRFYYDTSNLTTDAVGTERNVSGTYAYLSDIPATTTLNGFKGSFFNLLGSGNVTTSITNGSTTFSLVNSGVASGSYNWANLTVSSSGILMAASANSTPVTSLSGTANQITASASTGAVTLSLPATVNATNLNLSGSLGVSSTITQTGGVVSLASTTINGQATTTNLYVSNAVNVATSTSPGLAKILVNGQIKYTMPVDATTTTGTTTIDFSVAARQMITLGTATTTLYLTNTENGDSDAVKVCQDGTGSRTVTWTASSTNTSSTIDWGTAGAPTLSTAANKCDWFTFLTSPKNTNNASSVVDGFYGQNGYLN